VSGLFNESYAEGQTGIAAALRLCDVGLGVQSEQAHHRVSFFTSREASGHLSAQILIDMMGPRGSLEKWMVEYRVKDAEVFTYSSVSSMAACLSFCGGKFVGRGYWTWKEQGQGRKSLL
jgi:hypothetical protein